jgi:hypothetical protein
LKQDASEEQGLQSLFKNLNDATRADSEEAIINWQTKIFSKVIF